MLFRSWCPERSGVGRRKDTHTRARHALTFRSSRLGARVFVVERLTAQRCVMPMRTQNESPEDLIPCLNSRAFSASSSACSTASTGSRTFHAVYGEHEISVEVETDRVHGHFPPRALKLVLDRASR